MRTPHLLSIAILLSCALFQAPANAAARKSWCPARVLSFARKVPHLESILKAKIDGKAIAAYAGRIGGFIMGSTEPVGAPPAGWSLGDRVTTGPMQALMAAIVEDQLRDFSFGGFATEAFQDRLRGTSPTEGIVLIGQADGEFEAESRHWLGKDVAAMSYPRLLLAGTQSFVNPPMHPFLTAMTISPSLADHSDAISRMDLAGVTLVNASKEEFHIVLLGDFVGGENSKWVSEIVDTQLKAGTTKVILHVPTGVVTAGPRGDHYQPSTSLASDFQNRGPEAVQSWSREVLQTERKLRLGGVEASSEGVHYAFAAGDGQYVIVRTDFKP